MIWNLWQMRRIRINFLLMLCIIITNRLKILILMGNSEMLGSVFSILNTGAMFWLSISKKWRMFIAKTHFSIQSEKTFISCLHRKTSTIGT